MIKLKYLQRNCESGSISGKGIDWWWSGRETHGDMDLTEDIAKSVYAAVLEEWEDLLSEDWGLQTELADLPLEADVEWDGESVENVIDVRLLFEFTARGLEKPEQTLAEVQQYFRSPVVLVEPLKAGENVATVGDKTLIITID